jgi:Tannase and feruloyl esterase
MFNRSLLAMAFGFPAALFAANCEGLGSIALPNTTLTAHTVAAGGFTLPNGQAMKDLPAFCEVHGLAKPTESSVIHFEIWMPAENWNGKLQGIGNGGLAGTISYQPMGRALKMGYATASTDTGHTAQEPKTWLADRERLIDYSYRGLHLTTEYAKKIIGAYYSEAVKRSYYLGCSKGGQQGLMEAQRFPADYDGIVAGDAANYWTRQMTSEVWDGVATGAAESNLPEKKLELLQHATLAACDSMDGIEDGIISDPTRCKFDPKKLQCKGADEADCLTAAQVSAVEKIYSGPVNPRTHQKLYAGLYPGGEAGWGRGGVINRGSTSGVSSNDFWSFAVFHNPDWQFRSFDFDRDLSAAEEKLASITNATDANLEEFRKLGHKLLYYHGAADPLVPAQNGVDYFETVVKAQKGMDQTEQFFRVFLAPGLYHCAGGPGASGFGGSVASPVTDADHDMTSAVARWAEQGIAPERIVATKYVDNSPAKGVELQRPLCAYPLVARYKGSGDRNDAANFTCAK